MASLTEFSLAQPKLAELQATGPDVPIRMARARHPAPRDHCCRDCRDGFAGDQSGGFDSGGQLAAALENRADLSGALSGFERVGGFDRCR